jgi:hypothetical protein
MLQMMSRNENPALTSPINGLVGHLTQPLNDEWLTNSLWAPALTVILRQWMVIPSVTLVVECLLAVTS